jgi:predicted NAD-dependent protein-ADP-ribosyltransferase YbiA (DUF1768 family)
MHLRYIRLDEIRRTFNKRYDYWGITLPEHPAPSGEPDDDCDGMTGWSIDYALGEDDDGAPCLYVADNHRMTSPSFYAILESGETRKFDSVGIGFGYDPKIPGDHDRREREYFRHNRQISSLENLRGVGWGDNYYPVREDAGKDLTDAQFLKIEKFHESFARERGELETDGETVFGDDSPFSLWFPCTFRAYGLKFHSAGHHLEWLRATWTGRVDLAEAAYAAAPDDSSFAALRARRMAAPADLHSRRWEIGRLYGANRHKFLQDDDLRAALCATRGRLVYASEGDDLWGRTPGTAYELEEKGNCLGAALSLLRGDLLNEREYKRSQTGQ